MPKKQTQKKKSPPKKKKSILGRLFKFILYTTFILMLIFIGLVFAYNKFIYTGEEMSTVDMVKNVISREDSFKGKTLVTFAVLGLDELGTHTDEMLIGALNLNDNSISMMSVPRDTYTVMSEKSQNILLSEGLYVPPGGQMKMTEVYSYGTEKHGLEFILRQLEEDFNVKFDFYVKLDLEAFRYIIDAMGGVEFYVPQRMYYNDPSQDLYIDLQEGLQVLDGAQAEGLVRYRKADIKNPKSPGYKMGDLDRINVQHDFIKAVLTQAISKENIIKNLPSLVNTTFKYVDTNFNILDAPKIIDLVLKLDSSKINTYTMPYYFERINGIDYVVIDENKIDDVINPIFHPKTDVKTSENSSKNKDIVILNGSYTNGLAGLKKDELEKDGYTVTEIGNSETRDEITKIYVKSSLYGKDLQQYFSKSEIIVDTDLDTDIKIILGTQ